jgi:hypothetical protein
MTLKELHTKLASGYTHANLHAVTSKIIDLYKNKQHGAIEQIMTIVAGHTKEPKEPQSKSFYRLMMIYHPDRISHYQSEIEKYFKAGDKDQLLRFAHIFPVMDLERTLNVTPWSPPDVREPEEYGWDAEPDEFHDPDAEETEDSEEFDEFDEPVRGRSFFTAFKQSVYGTKNIDLPYYYLEELEILDMSGYDIGDLDGIGHCILLTTLDLSNNLIDDIADLSSLSHLREVSLSGNRIGYIDALGYCLRLKIVDLSYNNIDDISPLLGLEELEYVNLIGNPVDERQAAPLRSKNVMVIL